MLWTIYTRHHNNCLQGRLGRYRISGEIRRLRSQNCVNNTVIKQLYISISELLRSRGIQKYLICNFEHFLQDLPNSWRNSNFDQFLAISGKTLLKFTRSTNKNTICQAQICFQEILSFRMHYCTFIFINFEEKFKIGLESQFSCISASGSGGQISCSKLLLRTNKCLWVK